ncbi:B-cell CLL/lymphoma 6 member B protein-like protein, partial [Dinothrombium tinctorium]
MMRLRHANHSDDTTYHLIETYETQKFTDIVLICGEECTQVIKGHRLMLSKASNYFKKVIETALKHQDGYPVVPFIALKEIPFTDLKAIIDFIYHGKITIPKSQLDSLIRTAKFLEINGLQTLLSQTESIRKPENREVLKNEQETIAQKNSSETKTFEKTAKNDSKPSEIGDTPKDDKTILKQPETPANNAKTGKAVDIPCISNSTSITLTHSDPPI